MGTPMRVAIAAAALLAACSGDAADDAASTTTEATTTTAAPATTTSTTAPFVPVATHPVIASIWSPGRLDEGFVGVLPTLPGVVATSVVQGGRLMLRDGAPAGMGIPLDVLAIDTSTYPAFVAPEVQEPLARLRAGDAIVGETSAALRGGLTTGATISLLDGTTLTVTAVLPDAAVGGAEVVVARGAVPALTNDRYALIAHGGDVESLFGVLRDAYPADRPIRVRQAGEVPYLRHGDGVRTDAEVKSAFGELAFTEGPTRDFAAWDTAWAEANVGSITMPILGTVECHRAILPELRQVLLEIDALQQQLVAEQLAVAPEVEPVLELLEPDANLGCWNPRLIEPGAGVSRHAYGIAVDLRAPAVTGEHDPRVIEIFEAHGFTWGGRFLDTDPIHFEWVAI